MCGIAGVYSRRHFDLVGRARRMADAMRHRGPDAEGVCEANLGRWQGALGHRRLSIIDLSPQGSQPFRVPDLPLVLVYNGEIYNYRALRRELESHGARFLTETDTEVLLRAYAQWGQQCLDRLDGMFAFALWDEPRGFILLARDRFGIKPLYYAADPERFVFASEVRAVLASGLVHAELDPASVAGYLETGSVVSPRTTVRGVASLPPGHYAEWSDGTLNVTRYWDLGSFIPPPGEARCSPADVRALLAEAVQGELVSDVPIGVFLSGGVDSSALVACLASAGVRDLRTVSLVFDEPAYDESVYSGEIALQFSTIHTPIRVSVRTMAELLPDVAHLQDQPSVDGLNAYLISRAAREAGLTVALSGLGGDELYAGYTSFRLARLWSRWGSLVGAVPARARESIAHVFDVFTGGRYSKLARLAGTAADAGDIYRVSRELETPELIRTLLPPEVGAAVGDAWHSAVDCMDPVDTMTLLETGHYMLDTTLRQADIMSMAVSLEVRVPLLSHRVAECVIGTPPSARFRRGTPKPLLLDALPQQLPRTVTHRRKGTFTLPFPTWLRGDYRGLVEELLFGQATIRRGLFRTDASRQLWERFLEGRPGATWSRVWALCAFEAWCRRYLDQPVAA